MSSVIFEHKFVGVPHSGSDAFISPFKAQHLGAQLNYPIRQVLLGFQ